MEGRKLDREAAARSWGWRRKEGAALSIESDWLRKDPDDPPEAAVPREKWDDLASKYYEELFDAPSAEVDAVREEMASLKESLRRAGELL
eukprot:712206-Lingulodinium_polyedra.AAC.1